MMLSVMEEKQTTRSNKQGNLRQKRRRPQKFDNEVLSSDYYGPELTSKSKEEVDKWPIARGLLWKQRSYLTVKFPQKKRSR
ncbi:hypothetical protein RB195_017389 [Necator americanus]